MKPFTADLLDLALGASGGATAIVDLATGRLDASANLAPLFGLDSAETLTSVEQLRARHHPDDLERLEARARRAIEERTDFSGTHRVIWPDGSVHWLIHRGRFVHDDEGTATTLLSHLISADHRRAIESELEQARAGLVRTQRDGSLGTWDIDVGRQILTISPEFQEMLGVDRRRFTIEETLELIHESDRSQVSTALERLTQRGGSFEAEYRTIASGTERWVRARAEAVRGTSGEIVRVVGTSRDISEDRERLDTYERTRRLLDLLQEATRDLAFETDGNGDFVLCNDEGWEHLTGLDPGSWRGTGWLQAVRAEHREAAETAWRTSIAAAEPFDLELCFDHADGSPRWMLARVIPVRDHDGVTGFVGRAGDITALKAAHAERDRLQATLAQAQRLDAIGTLASGVAHDINNALAVVRLSLEVAAVEATGQGAEHFARMKAAIEQAQSVTAQLLTFARQASGDRLPVDLRELVAETVLLLEKLVPDAVVIELDPGRDEIWMSADPIQLRQALTNLIINASDAMPDGGTLRVELRADPVEPTEAILRVIDEGVGISPDHLARVFDPFFTTKPSGQGTGLGLAVTHGIITDHHGSIEIESDPGRSTTVTCRLPTVRPRLDPIDLTEPAPRKGSHRHVLVAEDNEPLREAVVDGLERAGYRITAVGDGLAALAAFDPSDPPAVAVLDVDLPGCSGVSCARLLRQTHGDLPVVFMTGSPDLDAIDGSDDVICKPFALSELVERIEGVGEEAATPASQPR